MKLTKAQSKRFDEKLMWIKTDLLGLKTEDEKTYFCNKEELKQFLADELALAKKRDTGSKERHKGYRKSI